MLSIDMFARPVMLAITATTVSLPVVLPDVAPTGATTAQPQQPLDPVCGTLPEFLNLIVPHDGGVVAATAAVAEQLDVPIAAARGIAVRGPDGTVWVEAAPDGRFGVYRIPPGGPGTLVAEGEVAVTGVGWLGGRSAAAVIEANGEARPDDPAGIGAVFADFTDGSRVELSEAGGWEWGVDSATIGADRVVERGTAEGYEWHSAFGPGGEPLEDWALPDENEPDVPPDRWWPIAAGAVDGGQPTLSWVEPVTDTNWNLVLTDAVSGRELHRTDLGEVGLWPVHADFDGRFWVGTFADDQDAETGEWQAVRIVAVDTVAAQPTAVEIACPAGTIATIDRLGVAAPPATPTTTTTTTTTAPPTTTTGRCNEYVDAEPEYPIRRCDKGWFVYLTQMLLREAGHDIDLDSYFGPATEQAVRAFQTDAGVEADGLVGPDTWSALIAGVPPVPGNDNDGNGIVDPWEFALDCGLTDGQWVCAGESTDS
jgi:peptidoglycan hydrolase-like protein with peptidoglycan-binding domain